MSEVLVLDRYRVVGRAEARLGGAASLAEDGAGGGALVEVHVLAATPERERAFAPVKQAIAALREAAGGAVARPLDLGWDADGSLVVAAEYVEGRTLAAAQAEAPLPPDRAREVLREVLHALVLARRAGVTHDRLSPWRVLLGPDGRVVVLDLGLAPLIGAGDADPLAAREAPYRAPGDVRGARADAYAVAALGLELLTGACPAPGAPLPSVPAEAARVVGTDLVAALCAVARADGTARDFDAGALLGLVPAKRGRSRRGRYAVRESWDGDIGAGTARLMRLAVRPEFADRMPEEIRGQRRFDVEEDEVELVFADARPRLAAIPPTFVGAPVAPAPRPAVAPGPAAVPVAAGAAPAAAVDDGLAIDLPPVPPPTVRTEREASPFETAEGLPAPPPPPPPPPPPQAPEPTLRGVALTLPPATPGSLDGDAPPRDASLGAVKTVVLPRGTDATMPLRAGLALPRPLLCMLQPGAGATAASLGGGVVHMIVPAVDEVSLGRERGNDVILRAFRDGVIESVDSNRISRRHVRLVRRGPLVLAEDQKSTYGSTLDGRRLSPREPTPLPPRFALGLAGTSVALAGRLLGPGLRLDRTDGCGHQITVLWAGAGEVTLGTDPDRDAITLPPGAGLVARHARLAVDDQAGTFLLGPLDGPVRVGTREVEPGAWAALTGDLPVTLGAASLRLRPLEDQDYLVTASSISFPPRT